MGKFKIVEGLELQNVSNTSKTNVLGYDSTTGEVTYQPQIPDPIVGNLRATGTITGSNLVAENDLYAKGMDLYSQPSVGYLNPVVINPTDGKLWQSEQQPLVGNVETVILNADVTLNKSSNPPLNEVNAGIILAFPNANNRKLKIGFPAGDANDANTNLSADWDKDFRCKIFNMGLAGTATSDQNYDIQIELVTPNSGTTSWKVYVIGENAAGTSQFSYNTVSQNSGILLSHVIKPQGHAELMMDYENGRIVLWGKSIT
jgi:hypothetical protein